MVLSNGYFLKLFFYHGLLRGTFYESLAVGLRSLLGQTLRPGTWVWFSDWHVWPVVLHLALFLSRWELEFWTILIHLDVSLSRGALYAWRNRIGEIPGIVIFYDFVVFQGWKHLIAHWEFWGESRLLVKFEQGVDVGSFLAFVLLITHPNRLPILNLVNSLRPCCRLRWIRLWLLLNFEEVSRLFLLFLFHLLNRWHTLLVPYLIQRTTLSFRREFQTCFSCQCATLNMTILLDLRICFHTTLQLSSRLKPAITQWKGHGTIWWD